MQLQVRPFALPHGRELPFLFHPIQYHGIFIATTYTNNDLLYLNNKKKRLLFWAAAPIGDEVL